MVAIHFYSRLFAKCNNLNTVDTEWEENLSGEETHTQKLRHELSKVLITVQWLFILYSADGFIQNK